jgi:hypothetical protein
MAVFKPTVKAGRKAGKYVIQFTDASGTVRRVPAFAN